MLDSRVSGTIGGAGQGAATGMTIGGPVGAGIGAVIGGVMGGLGGGGEKKAKRLAEHQAKIIRRTAEENERRATLEMEQVLGGTKAAIAANNILFTGSARNYHQQLESQLNVDIEWEATKARMEEKLALMGGQAAASQIQASGITSMVKGLGSAASAGAFGSYSKAGGYQSPWSK